MKVAICFAGLPYYIKQNQRYWQETIEKYNADVYASLWDEENVYQDGDTIQAFQDAYKPIKLEVENQKAFIKSFSSINSEYLSSPDYFNDAMHFAHKNGRPYSTLYKVWRANLFASEKEYDVVVRAETCSSYPDLKIVADDKLSVPYWHHIYWQGNYNTVNLNNWMVFGPQYIMEYYCAAFLKLRKYYDECFIQPIESIINHHLLQRPNIQLRLFFNKIFRKGVINWNGGKYNESVILQEPWYDSIGTLGTSDKDHADEYFKGIETYDTSINNKRAESLDLHKMAKGPIDIERIDLNTENQKEGEYQKVHLFNAAEKAKTDFSQPMLDEDGNWISQDNWMSYNKIMKEYD
tara:strand:- start:2842 stop:3891 length:1050 start_codon:yes stop_codon:yes gene_type:complete